MRQRRRIPWMSCDCALICLTLVHMTSSWWSQVDLPRSTLPSFRSCSSSYTYVQRFVASTPTSIGITRRRCTSSLWIQEGVSVFVQCLRGRASLPASPQTGCFIWSDRAIDNEGLDNSGLYCQLMVCFRRDTAAI